ncbi:hypothetical protein RvY_08265 [Ramazzottius varieornatus]|uniref:Uncharacterized protein n=1 Tax=Ramazzottius varieornatus TaxID=947166 RepID=A0A1D1V585_RAMVA|nr:hypothetical protein RvY_08265 [Ramazzottius varieornatus]
MGVTAEKMCGATPWSKASQLPSTPSAKTITMTKANRTMPAVSMIYSGIQKAEMPYTKEYEETFDKWFFV